MTKHLKHDSSDLADALEHVAYEMWKYKQSVAHYAEILMAGGDAAIEFRVLHHRVLLEFFYGPAKHPDNILACEYIDDWPQTHQRTSLPWLDMYMTRCHTMLAHISTARSEMAKQGRKAWPKDWGQVEPQLDQTISDFLRTLSQEHKKMCLQWINTWLSGNYPQKDVLKGLAVLIEPE